MKTIIDDQGIRTEQGDTGLEVKGTLTVNGVDVLAALGAEQPKHTPTSHEKAPSVDLSGYVTAEDHRSALEALESKLKALEEAILPTKSERVSVPSVASEGADEASESEADEADAPKKSTKKKTS